MASNIVSVHRTFERAIVKVLLCLLMVVVAYITGEIAFRVARAFWHGIVTFGATERGELIALVHYAFGSFLLVLIGIELMHTVVMYLDEHVVHVETVLSVAIIAVARHAIDLEFRTTPPLAIVGIAALLVALTGGYFLYKKTLAPARARA